MKKQFLSLTIIVSFFIVSLLFIGCNNSIEGQEDTKNLTVSAPEHSKDSVFHEHEHQHEHKKENKVEENVLYYCPMQCGTSQSDVSGKCSVCGMNLVKIEDEQHYSEKHKHKTAHGGIVVTSGNYHVEMVKNEGKVIFYLLDREENTLKIPNAKGRVIFVYKNGSQTMKNLQPENNEYLWTSLNSMGFVNCTVYLILEKEKLTANFGKEVK